jgi:hypothetical protein
LNSFLNSAMNIEYVSLILLGINNFISLKENEKNIRSSIDLSAEKDMKMKINKTNNQSKITFCNMQFQNVKEWDVEETLD